MTCHYSLIGVHAKRPHLLDCAKSRRVVSLEAPEVRLAKVSVQKAADMASTATLVDEVLFGVGDVAHALSLSSRRTGPTL